MDINAYVNEVKTILTGNILGLEIDDSTIEKLVNSAFREVQRYIDTTVLKTIPYQPCIDLTEFKVSSVSRVYRAAGYLTDQGSADGSYPADPMYVAQWQMMSGTGSVYNMSDWVLNYASWNTALQMRNNVSTDLLFRFDKHTNKLYINVGFDKPELITIEYVPRYNDVSEIVSDYWIDIIIRMSIALAKVTLGRIRSRYVQSNALWTMDGETLLNEGNQELTDLRTSLQSNTQLVYPID